MYHANMQWNTPIEFAIEVKNLEGLEASGPGSIDAKGIQGKQLSVSMSGEGDVTVAGKADLLDLYMSGVGKFHGERFQTEQATVRASGVGSAVVNVSDQLGATVSGTGSVQYIGSPRVRTSVSGFGHVKKYFGASAPEAVPSAPEPAEAAIEPPTTHAMNLGEDNLSLPMAAQDDAIPTAAAVSVAAPVAIRIFLVIIGGLLSSIGLLFVMWLFKSRRGQAAVLLVAGIMIGVVVLPVGVRLILGARYPTATKAPSAPRLWKKAAHQIAKVDARSEPPRESPL